MHPRVEKMPHQLFKAMGNLWERLTDWEKSPIIEFFRRLSKGMKAEALEGFRRLRERKIDAWVGFLGHESVVAREAAAEELVKIGKDAVPRLVGALGDGRYLVQKGAEGALIKIGEPAIPGLVQALSHGSLEARTCAARAIAGMSATRPKAGMREKFPELAEGLGNQEFIIRELIAVALIEIGPKGSLDLEALGKSAQKAKKEKKPVDGFAKVYGKWTEEMNRRANAIIADKKFHVPNVRKPDKGTDGMERILRVKRSA